MHHTSMGQCEIILQHSRDDDYILHILSGWTLGKDDMAAAKELEATGEKYSDLRHLAAACLLKRRQLRQAEK